MLDIFIENNVVGLDHQQIRRKYNDLKSKKKRRFADIVSACLFNFNKRQDVFLLFLINGQNLRIKIEFSRFSKSMIKIEKSANLFK